MRAAVTQTSVAGRPTVETWQAEQGLRVALVKRLGAVVALRLTFAVGSRDDVHPGAAHMAEHLLFRAGDAAEARAGVEATGGVISAATTREQVSLDAVCLPEMLPAALEAIARIARGVARPTHLERERPVVAGEALHDAEERRRLWQLHAEALFGAGHELARPIVGSPEDVSTLQSEHIAAVERRLLPRNAALALVGPVPGAHALVERHVRLRQPEANAGSMSLEPGPASLPPARRLHEERRSSLLHLAVGWRFGGISDPDLPAVRLLGAILAHGSGSRLYASLRTRRRLAYRIETVTSVYRDAGYLAVVTACDPHNGASMANALVHELEQLAGRGPSLSELDTAVLKLRGERARAFETSRILAAYSATQLLWGRASAISGELDELRAVTTGDIRRVAGRLVREGTSVASIGRTHLPRTPPS